MLLFENQETMNCDISPLLTHPRSSTLHENIRLDLSFTLSLYLFSYLKISHVPLVDSTHLQFHSHVGSLTDNYIRCLEKLISMKIIFTKLQKKHHMLCLCPWHFSTEFFFFGSSSPNSDQFW